jgi:hypothetical protein
LRIHIYLTLKPAHISLKALILPKCIVIITKTIRSLDALSATHHQKHYLEQHIIARLSILILSKTYSSVITTSPTLDMKGFLATGFLLLKSNKEYVITFKILEQVLVGLFFSILANLVQTKVVQYN